LVTSRIAGLHRGLVLELSVVHELGHGRSRGRGDLHQVEIGLPGKVKGLGDGNDADLFAVRTDESDLRHANALVDTRFGADGTSLGYFAVSDRPYPGPFMRKAPHDSHCGATTGHLGGRSRRGGTRRGVPDRDPSAFRSVRSAADQVGVTSA